jgi:hypothetical protein
MLHLHQAPFSVRDTRTFTPNQSPMPGVLKSAAAAARMWLGVSSYSPACSGRSRLLRAACQPCSRGPAPWARWSTYAHTSCRAALVPRRSLGGAICGRPAPLYVHGASTPHRRRQGLPRGGLRAALTGPPQRDQRPGRGNGQEEHTVQWRQILSMDCPPDPPTALVLVAIQGERPRTPRATVEGVSWPG